MSASLLPEDSAAADSCRELLADFPQFREVPGLPQARMLVEYIIGRRRGELDVSGRDAAGTFIDAAALAEVPTGSSSSTMPGGSRPRCSAASPRWSSTTTASTSPAPRLTSLTPASCPRWQN